MDNKQRKYTILYINLKVKSCALMQIAFFKNLISRKWLGIERISLPRLQIACHMLRLDFGTPEKVETTCGYAIQKVSNLLILIAQHRRTNRRVRTLLSLQFIGCVGK